MRTKFLLFLFINMFIFSYIFFFYSPKIPLNENIVLASSLRTDFDLVTNQDTEYIMGYIKNFSPNILYDVSVHIEFTFEKQSEVLTKNVGALNPGEVKTYIFKIEGKKIQINKEWATYSFKNFT